MYLTLSKVIVSMCYSIRGLVCQLYIRFPLIYSNYNKTNLGVLVFSPKMFERFTRMTPAIILNISSTHPPAPGNTWLRTRTLRFQLLAVWPWAVISLFWHSVSTSIKQGKSKTRVCRAEQTGVCGRAPRLCTWHGTGVQPSPAEPETRQDRLCLHYLVRGVNCGQLLHLRAFGEEVAILETNGPWLPSLLDTEVFSLKSEVMNPPRNCLLLTVSVERRADRGQEQGDLQSWECPWDNSWLLPTSPTSVSLCLPTLSLRGGLRLPWQALELEFSENWGRISNREIQLLISALSRLPPPHPSLLISPGPSRSPTPVFLSVSFFSLPSPLHASWVCFASLKWSEFSVLRPNVASGCLLSFQGSSATFILPSILMATSDTRHGKFWNLTTAPVVCL